MPCVPGDLWREMVWGLLTLSGDNGLPEALYRRMQRFVPDNIQTCVFVEDGRAYVPQDMEMPK